VQRLTALFGLVVVCLLAATPAAVSQTGTNLIANPGAEDSAARSCTAETGWTPPVSWQVTAHFEALGTDCPDPVRGALGKAYFAGGDRGDSTATQTVDLSARAAAIDAGGMRATLSGLLGGWQTQRDSATVTATFLDSSGSGLGGTLRIGPVTVTDRGGVTKVLPRTATGAVPPHARTARIVIAADYVDGAVYNDGYADEVSLVLTQGSPPPPPRYLYSFSVRGTPMSAGRLGALYVRTDARGTGSFASEQPPGNARGVRFVSVLSAKGGIAVIHRYAHRNVVLAFTIRRGDDVFFSQGKPDRVQLVGVVTHSEQKGCRRGSKARVVLEDEEGFAGAHDAVALEYCGRDWIYVEGRRNRVSVSIRSA
jgi:hypothetical protein